MAVGACDCRALRSVAGLDPFEWLLVHQPHGPYEYLSYHFANTSEGIVRIFLNACEMVGVFCRVNFIPNKQGWAVRINRRDSVAILLESVGVKE